MGSYTSDPVALAAPKREGALPPRRVSPSFVPSNHQVEAGLSNDPLEPPPRIPVRSSLLQKASNSRINLGVFSSKRSSNNTSTPPPGSPSYPSSISAVTHAVHRISWLSGTTSSVSLSHGQSYTEAPSPAGSRVSLSTAGGSSCGASTAPRSLPRKVTVSDPFMFPLVAAPSPTHSASVLSPALLEVPFSPSRTAPSPLSAVQGPHGDNISEIGGSQSGSTTTVHAIRAPRGMVGSAREPAPPSVRSHRRWLASWGLSRVQKIFQGRQKAKASPLAPDPASTSLLPNETARVVSAKPMGQRQASLVPSSPPHTPSRTLGVRRSLRNVRVMFAATAISPPLPQTSVLFHPETDNNSFVDFPPPTPSTRPRGGKGRSNNGMLSVVGELGEGTQRGDLEGGDVKPEATNKISANANRSNRKGKRLGNAEGVSREATASGSAAPASLYQDSIIRQNSVIGYIYPCKYCTRNWLEECSCLATRGIEPASAPQRDSETATSTRSPPQGIDPPLSAPPSHNPPNPDRRNSQFEEGLEGGRSTDTSHVGISQPPPRPLPAPSPQLPYASRSRLIFSSLGNRHGRRGGSDELAKQGQGRFSWSNISLPISTTRSSSSTPLGVPVTPPTNSKRIPSQGSAHRVVRSAQPSPTLPPPPTQLNAPSLVLSPAARDVLGIPSSTIIARRARTASGQHQPHYDHQRHSSTASGSSSASQPGAPLRLWSSRPSSGSDAQGMVVVPTGIPRGRVSLRSVASATGVGVGAGELERQGGEEMDPVRERDRMRRGLIALGLLNEEGVEVVGQGGEGRERGAQGAQGGERVLGEVRGY